MGYCGIKISGHTGIDFKHKKAFSDSKKLLNYERKTANVKVEPREKNNSPVWLSYFKISIAIASIFTLSLLVYFFVYRINNISINKTHLSS